MLGKVLFFGRKNDPNVSKLLSYIKKKTKKINIVWSNSPGEKLKLNKFFNEDYDYIFSFRSFYILKKKLIHKAKFAAINFHPSIPKYRGMGCLNFAMYNNEKFYGTTAHLIDSKIDHGKILNVKRFKLLKRYSVETLLEKTHHTMLKQAIEIINLLYKNKKNLHKLIEKSKNEKWSKKKRTRKDLDNFYNIKNNITHDNLIRKIRACYIYDSFRPYFMLHKYKFVLINPFHEKGTKRQKYKMYFNLPSDLRRKNEKN